MAEISKIKLPSGTYDVKDTTARNGLNGKSNNGHTHDDRYFTESEINSFVYKDNRNDGVNNTVNWNTLTSAGSYKVQVATWGDASKLNSPNSLGGGIYAYGILMVFKTSNNDSEHRICQLYMPHNTGQNTWCFRWHNGNDLNSGWSGWNWLSTDNNTTYDLSQYVKTGDSRLSNARPASDVKDWAKKNTLSDAINSSLTTGNSTPVDGDYYISQYVNGGTTTTTFHRRPMSALWEYVKGKISSVLGLTKDSYGGKASTAGTADNATKANGHTVNSDVPSGAKFTDTNTWRGITDSYSGTDSGTSFSQKGAKDLYDNLHNGYASSAGNADTVDNCHESSFLRFRDNTSTNGADTLWSQIGIREYDGALPKGITGDYNYGSVVSFPSSGARFDLWYNHQTSINGNGLKYRTGWNEDQKAWATIIDSNTIGSQSVNYANSAGNATKVNNHSVNADVPSNAKFTDTNTVTNATVDGDTLVISKS